MIRITKIFTVLVLSVALLLVNCCFVFADDAIIDNGEKMVNISSINIEQQRDIMARMGINTHEQNVAMLRDLGFAEDILERLDTNAINQIFENALSIDTQVYYLKSNENGDTQLVTEADCIAAVEESKIALLSNGGSDAEYPDEYMRVTLTRTYLDPSSQNGEKGWYMLYTWYDWMTIPNKRLIDAFSVASSDFNWDTSSQYYTEMGYNATDINDRSYHFEVQDYNDLYLKDDGYYYTWQLPEDNERDQFVITSCNLYSHVKCRIKNPNVTHDIVIYVKYIHSHPLTGSVDNLDYTWTNSSFIGVKYSGLFKTNYELQVECKYDVGATN